MSNFRMLLLCVLFMAVPAVIVMSQPAPPPVDMLDALRRGGHVIVLRHGATTLDVAKDGMSGPGTAVERQLSDAGRAQAVTIGESLRTLGIRVGLVITSPLQRAVDTATLLDVGKPRINPALAEIGATVPPAEKEQRAKLLRKLVGFRFGDTNLVIVTHRPNLVEAFGESLADMREGEAAVFEPDITGTSYRLMARFEVGDWDLLVQASRAEELDSAPHCASRQGPSYD